jgi:hypothetical protein
VRRNSTRGGKLQRIFLTAAGSPFKECRRLFGGFGGDGAGVGLDI